MAGRFSFLYRRITIVGILNVTPDSFSDGGKFGSPDLAIKRGLEMIGEGAHLIDVGGESTRPGSEEISPEIELARILPVVRGLVRNGVAVSIDTRRASVASACLEDGAVVVNDVSGLRDPEMIQVVSRAKVPVVIMHTPIDGMGATHAFRGYQDVVAEVIDFLAHQAKIARANGIQEVVLDPGLGFGKSTADNLSILHGLPRLTGLGYPVMVGASRKRFIGEISGIAEPARRDLVTIGVNLAAMANAARVFRVHDVVGHVQAFAGWSKVVQGQDLGKS